MKEGASIVDHVNKFNSNLSRKTSREYSNSLLSAKDKGRGKTQDKGQKENRGRSKSKKRYQSKNRQNITCWNYNQKGHFQNQCPKPVASKDKEVNMTVRDYDDALLEKFRLRSSKVRLADDNTLDIVGVRDVVLKTSFGISWNLKDVRYIPDIKRRLIYAGQLDEEGYHVPSDGINTVIDGMGNPTLWHKRLGHMSDKGMKILASKGRISYLQKAVASADHATMLPLSMTPAGREFLKYCAENGIMMLKTVPETPQQNGVKDVKRDKLDAKSMKCTFIGYGSDEMGYSFWDLKGHKVVQSRDVTFNKDSLYGSKAEIDYGNLMKPNQKDQVVLEDSPENLANISIVAEQGLSLKITQSPCGSSDTSEGSENSGSFEDSIRLDEEDSKDEAFSKEGGSETLQVRRYTRESRASVRGFSVSWERRKPRVQVEEKSVRIKASTEIMEDTAYLCLHFIRNHKESKSNTAYPEDFHTPKLFKTLSLNESRSPMFDLYSDLEENSEEEVAETMAKTMEEYISKTRADYGLGVTRPKIDDKDHFELKGQFFKELRDNTFSGLNHEDANEHIEKVLEIVDLFYIPNTTQDQIMLRAFSMSLTGAASRRLRNKPSGLIKTWEDLQAKFPKMQEVILFYNGLEVPTRQILDSKGAIPTKTAADAKIAIQEMVEYYQKWYNGTSQARSTETSNRLAAIQAQLNNLGREIKKVNEKVYAAQVGCKQCKGPHNTKDCPLKEEGKTLKEAFYTQFGVPFQQGG
nr:hypothetical protein [Tanacetum cinerariifolium]